MAQTPRRVSEARRLGFDQLVVPESAPDVAGVTYLRAPTLATALDLVRHGERVRTSTIAPWYLVAAPTWSKPSELSRLALRCAKASTASSKRRWAR